MKIKGFIKYLENLREDEFSHLNDKLSANNEGRNDYDYNDDSTKNYSDNEDWYDEEDEDYYASRKSSNSKFNDDDDVEWEDEDEYDENDDVDHLLYLLRQMFRNSGVEDVRVSAKRNEDIVVQCYMKKRETLRNIVKVFEVANKLKRDILSQYDSEFGIWESRVAGCILTFGFTLNEGLDDDNLPF